MTKTPQRSLSNLLDLAMALEGDETQVSQKLGDMLESLKERDTMLADGDEDGIRQLIADCGDYIAAIRVPGVQSDETRFYLLQQALKLNNGLVHYVEEVFV